MRPEHLHCPNTAEGIRRINEMQEVYDRNPEAWERQERERQEQLQEAEQEAYYAEMQRQQEAEYMQYKDEEEMKRLTPVENVDLPHELLSLIDKNGKQIPVDSIIYGSLPNNTEKHYFNIGYGQDGSIEMIACTYGYVHNVEQADINNFEYIGLAKDNLHLLECD